MYLIVCLFEFLEIVLYVFWTCILVVRKCKLINKQLLTSATLCCLYQRRLEHCFWPRFWDKTVWVSNHRKHHGRCRVDSILDFSPYLFHFTCVLNYICKLRACIVHFFIHADYGKIFTRRSTNVERYDQFSQTANNKT